eukprot:4077752-Prymnesium_polylepis.3
MLSPLTAAARRWCPEVLAAPKHRGTASGGPVIEALRKQPPGLVLDVGAYDGAQALAFAATGHRVYAFEPSPSKAPLIRAAFEASAHAARLTLFPVAVSNETGSTAFYVTTQRSSRSRTIHNGFDGSEQDQLDPPPWPSNRTVVRVDTLDNVVGNSATVLYAKIDAQWWLDSNCRALNIKRAGCGARVAQGHDWTVLRGARRLVTSHRLQRVAFELWPGKEGATGRTERANEYIRTATWLMAHGYSCHKCSKYQTQSES